MALPGDDERHPGYKSVGQPGNHVDRYTPSGNRMWGGGVPPPAVAWRSATPHSVQPSASLGTTVPQSVDNPANEFERNVVAHLWLSQEVPKLCGSDTFMSHNLLQSVFEPFTSEEIANIENAVKRELRHPPYTMELKPLLFTEARTFEDFRPTLDALRERSWDEEGPGGDLTAQEHLITRLQEKRLEKVATYLVVITTLNTKMRRKLAKFSNSIHRITIVARDLPECEAMRPEFNEVWDLGTLRWGNTVRPVLASIHISNPVPPLMSRPFREPFRSPSIPRYTDGPQTGFINWYQVADTEMETLLMRYFGIALFFVDAHKCTTNLKNLDHAINPQWDLLDAETMMAAENLRTLYKPTDIPALVEFARDQSYVLIGEKRKYLTNEVASTSSKRPTLCSYREISHIEPGRKLLELLPAEVRAGGQATLDAMAQMLATGGIV